MVEEITVTARRDYLYYWLAAGALVLLLAYTGKLKL